MFMTFASASRPSASRQGSMMRPLRTADARLGTSRRAACVSCRNKKVRCTGDLETCDNCTLQGVSCEPSRGRRQPSTGTSVAADIIGGNRLQEAIANSRRKRIRKKARLDGQSIDVASDFIKKSPMGPIISSQNTIYNDLQSPSNNANRGQVVSPTSQSDCACIDNILETLQKLDDDEFGLRLLAFDQLLKLQKWLVFRCLGPLQCPRCGPKLTTQGTVLIICERIVSMFQCVSKRLQRLRQALTQRTQRDGMEAFGVLQLPQGVLESSNPRASADEGDERVSLSPLLEGESDEPDGFSGCTLHLFSSELRAEYSSDEQCAIIQVLARKQIEKSQRLLDQLATMAGTNHARIGRVRATKKRLEKEGNAVDEILDGIAHAFDL